MRPTNILALLLMAACQTPPTTKSAGTQQPREYWTPPAADTASDTETAPLANTGAGGIPAFPGAEGFGAGVTGGRGGRVIVVTTLAADGPGSLQAAVEEPGPRIIVFGVSGVIEGDITIEHSDVTIAGQTAPGAGITIKGRLYGKYDNKVENMILRHIRVRPVFKGGHGHRFDAVQLGKNSRLILDHMSVAFGIDETVDFYESDDVTIQWSTITSSGEQGHVKGRHNYGLIHGSRGNRISVHHNFFAHHKNRNPAIANGPAEVYNNVMYNVRIGFVHHNPARGAFSIVGNHFRAGPSATLQPFYFDDEDKFKAPDLSYYLNDNLIDSPKSKCNGRVDNPWQQCKYNLKAPESNRTTTKPEFTSDLHVPVTVQPSSAVFDSVLTKAGAFPHDTINRRVALEARNRDGEWGARYPTDYMAGLAATKPPADGDRDGMADAWESKHGLNPKDRNDHRKRMPSGYTAIEEYINELATRLVAGS